MADATTKNSTLQTQGDVPQNNDSTTIQQQNQNNLPSTLPTTTLQPTPSNVNDLKTTNLAVKSGPADGKGKSHSSGTVISIVLVVVILGAAIALFVASLRVDKKEKEAKPAVAVGGEESGAQGTKKKKFKRNKKNKRR